jgi:hypothetical protein
MTTLDHPITGRDPPIVVAAREKSGTTGEWLPGRAALRVERDGGAARDPHCSWRRRCRHCRRARSAGEGQRRRSHVAEDDNAARPVRRLPTDNRRAPPDLHGAGASRPRRQAADRGRGAFRDRPANFHGRAGDTGRSSRNMVGMEQTQATPLAHSSHHVLYTSLRRPTYRIAGYTWVYGRL